VNSLNAHLWMPTRRRAATPAPLGRSAPIGYGIVVESVRFASVLLKEEET